ncbi:MAG: type I glyceraldehyde-3-phosphate dehydrogenase [Candidatus Desulfobacillus denitrificans]|nr:type I glyceraldehyde-3-phosphate dehydrogenase [Chloroflexi bacterium CFX1]MCK6568337.1 type I glyceraldehyde-3-phosphate dehydrogenase [Anaerolineales bacterium]MCQ3951988.1 type I glyceraldehyde-3-phosphate dehydrogenase [Chloroflexota bacterium]MDL1919262.1 type I glyceraldehyde-3-phosphate dehydrogenase [Chloroflexi bacterium CFX5]NUQ59583.1 type I glyceraldehyde-3-phosphate dehydrogenase [Anaerolineales bacterium]
MTVKIGINGFGRIGRQVLKAIRDRYPQELEVVAFNDIGDLKTMAHLLKYDSNYGRFDGAIEVADDALVVDGKKIKVFKETDPAAIPWGSLGVDIVIESTGLFTIKEDGVNKKGKAVKGAASHIKGGAKKVIISAPAEGEDLTIVMGVNEDKYDPKNHHVVSNASCTTNCLAPAAKVVHDNFTIKRGFMTTVHAYTNDQKILDLPHSDLRRARAAAMSIIPTTTGAAKAVSLVIPDLKGKFDGYALRVPTSTVSIVDFTAELEKETSTEDLRALFREAAKQPRFKGILQAVDEPLVSIDYKGDPHSSSVDLQFTMVLGKEKSNFVKVVTWYDNEWGYSCRTADLAALMAKGL